MLLFIFLLHNSLALATPIICPEGQHWVNAHSRRAYYRHDGTFVNAAAVTAHCKSNPESYKFWEPKLRNGLPNGWPYKTETRKNWTIEEQERLFDSLNIIPKILWNAQIDGIYRASKSKDFPNPATSAKGVIVLYDTGFESKNIKYALPRVVAHELAHQIFLDLSDQEKADYSLNVNWHKDTTERENVLIYSRKTFVEPDGTVSTEEDFANNVEYTLFDPDRLKSVTPKAHEWIKKYFGDKLKLVTEK